MKIMAFDFGDARTGIAISDPLEMLTGFTTVIHAYTPEKAAAAVAQLVQEHRAEALVVGLPRNMDGSEGERAARCRAFAALLEEKTRPYAGDVGRAPHHGGCPPNPIR